MTPEPPAASRSGDGEVRLGDEVLIDITGWDQMYLNPLRTTIYERRGHESRVSRERRASEPDRTDRAK